MRAKSSPVKPHQSQHPCGFGHLSGTPATRSRTAAACGYDLAGAALKHIYGSLDGPKIADGTLLAFDQTEFVKAGETHGLAGYTYVPEACMRGAPLPAARRLSWLPAERRHGRRRLYRHAGYNEWAEANDIVVLYPQAVPVLRRLIGMPLEWPNRQGCWDWWGFTGEDFARKSGPQIRAVDAMTDRLAGKAASMAHSVCH